VLLWYIELYRNKFDCYANISCKVMFVSIFKINIIALFLGRNWCFYLNFFEIAADNIFFFGTLISKFYVKGAIACVHESWFLHACISLW